MRVIRFAHTAINMLSHIIACRSHIFALKVQHIEPNGLTMC